jgi:Secretion system C-terminal sorting domain
MLGGYNGNFLPGVPKQLSQQSEENTNKLSFKLGNYPNPFNPTTTITYEIPKDGFVTLKVYDILGREVATLVNEFKTAGKYYVNFNAGNLASGMYFYRFKSGSYISTKKMMLLK